MMLSLFDIFDPYMGYYIYNWFSLLFFLFLGLNMYWLFKSRFLSFLFFIMMYLWNEFKVVVGNMFNQMNLLIFVTMFMMILLNNFMGLFPYIFTVTSHLSYSLLFSISMWLGLMIFGWMKNMKFMLIHLVPMGTPFLLMFFMVLIETLSNIIRPMTLSIRLVANMIAGHLLLSLLSSFMPMNLMYLFGLLIQLMLLMLEIGVSLIQSYVFVILMILYMKETN